MLCAAIPELFSLYVPPENQNCRETPPCPFYVALGIEPRAFCVSDKPSTYWTVSVVPAVSFHVTFCDWQYPSHEHFHGYARDKWQKSKHLTKRLPRQRKRKHKEGNARVWPGKYNGWNKNLSLRMETEQSVIWEIHSTLAESSLTLQQKVLHLHPEVSEGR